MLKVVIKNAPKLLAPLLLLALAPAAQAHERKSRRALGAEVDAAGHVEPPLAWQLGVRGFADLQAAWFDYGEDQNRPGGAPADSRVVLDTTRFVLEVEGLLPGQLEFEAEVEFEHHGAGAAMELEYEEFGEFEQEVESGGEVMLEELNLRKQLGPVALRIGRFYLGVGLLSEIYRPTEYLASTQPESEVAVIPAVWDEIGLELSARLGTLLVTAQLVNGLDSTGFSSQRWIASGHQQRFELTQASSPAAVLRLDWFPSDGVQLGASAYYGGTTSNRPKRDLDVSADVLLLDAHAVLDLAPWSFRACVLWGHLSNAEAVSERTARLSTAINVLRSAVADQAFFAWAELGLDLGDALALPRGHHLEPYLRVEYYDTMFAVSGDTFDNPRFGRFVTPAGLGWGYGALLFAKLDVTHRDLAAFASSDLRDETSVRLSTGFTF
ncbi:MAG: hypothetical protein U1F43_29330 [Myxococcota bacterium]